MTDKLYYLDRFSDEVMPCAPTLEAWAEWLSKPDQDWNRTEPAQDGETFAASTLILLGDRRAIFADGRWTWAEPPPEGTDEIFLRPHEGATGWDADFSGNDLENAASGLEDWCDDGEVWFACVKHGPDFQVRFHAAGPRLEAEPRQ